MPSVQTEGPEGGTTGVVAPSRRSLVRAGVAAAWTAPLVQVLAAAPAQAVGSGVVLSMTGTFSHAAGNRDFKFVGTLANNGTQTTANLQVTMTLTTNGTTDWTGVAVQTGVSGFTAGSPTLGGSSGAYTVTVVFTKTAQMGASTSTAFSPTLRCNTGVKSVAGTGSITATATGAISSGTSNAYTA